MCQCISKRERESVGGCERDRESLSVFHANSSVILNTTTDHCINLINTIDPINHHTADHMETYPIMPLAVSSPSLPFSVIGCISVVIGDILSDD